jgi:hypothetical protein
VGEMLLSQDDIKTLIAEKAQADLRKVQVPDKPEFYAAELPKEFKLPDGLEYRFDDSSPILADARAWAHREGLTQFQFSQLLSFHASTQIAEQQLVANAAKVEVGKLGGAWHRTRDRSRHVVEGSSRRRSGPARSRNAAHREGRRGNRKDHDENEQPRRRLVIASRKARPAVSARKATRQ